MRKLDLDALVLARGGHDAIDAGACVMEAVSYVAGEPWSDRPNCVSPVIVSFLRQWNDHLGDAERQTLKPYIPRVIGTNTGAADDDRRAWMITDWMVRVYLPAWLRVAKLDDQAAAVEGLAELLNPAAWGRAKGIVESARKARDAAWEAARAAAWEAAREALKPTGVSLQRSALDLLDRMIAVGGTR